MFLMSGNLTGLCLYMQHKFGDEWAGPIVCLILLPVFVNKVSLILKDSKFEKPVTYLILIKTWHLK